MYNPSLITIVKDKKENIVEDIWKRYIKPYKQTKGLENVVLRGAYIAKEERKELKRIVVDSIKRIILPWAERKLKLLIAANAPKAIFGFFSKEVTGTPRTGESTVRPEWDLRFAGDFAFMLQDYSNALANYKRLWDRIHKGTTFEEMGSCKEAIAITSILIEVHIKDFMKNMEAAAQYYTKCKNTILLTKNGIYAYDILARLKCHPHAAEHLARINNYVLTEKEVPGLFSEQSAFELIKSSAPSVRRLARNLMHAGNYYLEQALSNNALNCSMISYCLYKKAGWPGVLISICKSLAKAYANVNNYQEEFEFYRRLLKIAMQWKFEGDYDSYLKALLTAAEKFKSTTTLPPEEINHILQTDSLLEINGKTVGVFTSQDKLYSNVEAMLYHKQFDLPTTPVLKLPSPEGVYNTPQTWMTLGKMIDGDLSNPYDNSVDTKQKLKEEKLRDLRFYDEQYTPSKTILYTKRKRFVYANEYIYLSFQCKNPLRTALKLTQLSIKCHYIDKEGACEQQSGSLILGAGETKEILLCILPKEEGELVIDGLQWTVSDNVPGSFLMSKILGNTSIVLIVRSKVGLLDLSTDKNSYLEHFDGVMDSYTLMFKNIGDLAISQVTLQTDYPLLFGWRSIKLDWTLNPGEQKELAINFRAGMVEDDKRLNPKILIRYVANDSETPYYRYKRIAHSFIIRDLLVLKTDYNRSYTTLGEYFLNFQIERFCTSCTAFNLNEICVIENDWRIFEKKRVQGFDKIFNSFFTLVHSDSIVPLNNKRIIFTSNTEPIDLLDIPETDLKNPSVDITQIEENANYIKEYKAAKEKTDSHLNLLISWNVELGTKKSKGINILPITLNAQSTAFPLKVVHRCQTLCVHDFSTNPMCRIPFSLFVQNISLKETNFRFEALKIHREKKEKSADFVWQGTETVNCLNIPPNGQSEIQLDACMMGPGVYDLNRFSFMFFREKNTGEHLDPSVPMPKDITMDLFELESEQILVTILQSPQ